MVWNQLLKVSNDAKQVAILRKLQCDTIQGYYYSKPLNRNDFEKLLLQNDFEKERDNRKMILIIGQTHDDIFILKISCTTKKNEELFNTIPLITGTIYNQDVCLAYNVYSNYISSLIITHLIRSKFVILFSVGKAKTYFDDLQVGDVVLSNSITLGDVDFTNENNCKLGQIPFCLKNI